MTYMSDKQTMVNPAALFFQALANPTRMQILHLLRDKGSMSVSQVCEQLGLEQTQVSHNLKCLTFCGLAVPVREGKSRIYSVNDETVGPLLRIVDRHLTRYARNLFSCDVLER